MIIHSVHVPKGERFHCDICIIGAGAAGITIAKAFDKTPYSVFLVESGGFTPNAETQSLYETDFSGHLAQKAAGYPSYSRTRYFGGSTNCWAGDVAPFEAIDFERRDWIPHSGWPIEKDDLWSHYRKACELVEVPYFEKNPAAEEISRRNPFKFKSFLNPLFEPKTFLHSPPTRFGLKYREELLSSKNVSVMFNANVISLNVGENGEQVESVETVCLENMGRIFVSSKIFILATGAIENARLLLASDQVHKSGLGNQNDLVGRYYMDHYRLSGYKLMMYEPDLLRFLDLTGDYKISGRKAHKIFTPSGDLQKKYKLMNSGVYIQEFVPVSPQQIGFAWKVFSKKKEALPSVQLHEAKITVFGEQAPDADNRVVLTGSRNNPLNQRKPKLIWNPNDLDRESTQRLLELLGREVGRLNLGRIKLARDLENFEVERCSLGYHHMGTTRMHESPKEGVVNADCKVFGLDNLYVSGSSVFPTGSFINPTLTIVALASRLAEHVHQHLRKLAL